MTQLTLAPRTLHSRRVDYTSSIAELDLVWAGLDAARSIAASMTDLSEDNPIRVQAFSNLQAAQADWQSKLEAVRTAEGNFTAGVLAGARPGHGGRRSIRSKARTSGRSGAGRPLSARRPIATSERMGGPIIAANSG